MESLKLGEACKMLDCECGELECAKANLNYGKALHEMSKLEADDKNLQLSREILEQAKKILMDQLEGDAGKSCSVEAAVGLVDQVTHSPQCLLLFLILIGVGVCYKVDILMSLDDRGYLGGLFSLASSLGIGHHLSSSLLHIDNFCGSIGGLNLSLFGFTVS